MTKRYMKLSRTDCTRYASRLSITVLALVVSAPVQATVLITGDSFDSTPHYYVIGQYGSGAITVDNGSSFTWNGTPATPPFTSYHQSGIIFSRYTSSSANGLITGTGSEINLVGNGGPTFFQVGRGGTGDLTIQNGGRLNIVDPNAALNTIPGNSTQLIVGGSGSQYLPVDGTGTLTADDGHIYIEGNRSGLTIGDGGGNGTVTFTNNSTLMIKDHDVAGNTGAWLVVGRGRGGSGTLNITDSTVNSYSDNNDAGVSLGLMDPGTDGRLTISGPSASANFTAPNGYAYFNIGRETGTIGQAVVDNGAQVSFVGDRAIVNVSRDSGSLGTLHISNGGQVSLTGATDSDVLIGYARDHDNDPNTARVGGTGIVTVTGTGSHLSTGDKIVVGSPISFFGGGASTGLLTVTNGGQVTAGDGVYVGLGGIFNGSAFVNGNVINDGGVVAPGNSPGTMTITGNYIQSANSILQMEVNGNQAGDYDILNVLGDLDITTGIIEMIFSDSFLAQIVSDIALMPSLNDMFIATGIKSLDTSLIQASAAGYNSVNLVFDNQGSLSAVNASVPVPATLLLVVIGLGGIAYKQRKLIS